MNKQTMIIEFDAIHYSLVTKINNAIREFLTERELETENDTVVETRSFITNGEPDDNY